MASTLKPVPLKHELDYRTQVERLAKENPDMTVDDIYSQLNQHLAKNGYEPLAPVYGMSTEKPNVIEPPKPEPSTFQRAISDPFLRGEADLAIAASRPFVGQQTVDRLSRAKREMFPSEPQGILENVGAGIVGMSPALAASAINPALAIPAFVGQGAVQGYENTYEAARAAGASPARARAAGVTGGIVQAGLGAIPGIKFGRGLTKGAEEALVKAAQTGAKPLLKSAGLGALAMEGYGVGGDVANKAVANIYEPTNIIDGVFAPERLTEHALTGAVLGAGMHPLQRSRAEMQLERLRGKPELPDQLPVETPSAYSDVLGTIQDNIANREFLRKSGLTNEQLDLIEKSSPTALVDLVQEYQNRDVANYRPSNKLVPVGWQGVEGGLDTPIALLPRFSESRLLGERRTELPSSGSAIIPEYNRAIQYPENLSELESFRSSLPKVPLKEGLIGKPSRLAEQIKQDEINALWEQHDTEAAITAQERLNEEIAQRQAQEAYNAERNRKAAEKFNRKKPTEVANEEVAAETNNVSAESDKPIPTTEANPITETPPVEVPTVTEPTGKENLQVPEAAPTEQTAQPKQAWEMTKEGQRIIRNGFAENKDKSISVKIIQIDDVKNSIGTYRANPNEKMYGVETTVNGDRRYHIEEPMTLSDAQKFAVSQLEKPRDKQVQNEVTNLPEVGQNLPYPDKRKLSVYRLVADYRARGIDKNRAWDQFIIDRALKPEIDAKDFYAIFDKNTEKKLLLDYPDLAKEYGKSTEPANVTAAKKRLNKNLSNISANPMLNPEVWKDLTVIGAHYIRQGAKSLADFTVSMQKELGNRFDEWKAHIPKLYDASVKYHNKNPQRDPLDAYKKSRNQAMSGKESVKEKSTPEQVYENVTGFLNRKLSDTTNPIMRVAEKLGIGKQVDSAIRSVRMNEGIQDTWIRKGNKPLNSKLEPSPDVKSVGDILEPYKTLEEQQGFWDYYTARIITDTADAKPDYFETRKNPKTGVVEKIDKQDNRINVENERKIVEEGRDKYEKSYQEFQKLYEFALKDYLEAGGNPEDFARITGGRKSYAPLYHAYSAKDGSMVFRTPEGKFADLKNGVRRLGEVGGEVKRMTPAEAAITHITQMVDLTARERMMNEIVNAVGNLRKTDPDLADSILEQHKVKWGERLDPISMQKAQLIRAGKEVITNPETGEKRTVNRYFHVPDKVLYDAFEGMNPTQTQGVVKLLEKSARLFRTFTIENPAFSVMNLVRDSISGTLFTKSTNAIDMIPGVLSVRGFSHILRNTIESQMAKGAGATSPISKFINPSASNRVSPEQITNAKRYYMKHPYQGVQVLTTLIENSTRMGEAIQVARQAMKQGIDPIEAWKIGAKSAREISLQFEKGGQWSKELNKVIPFFNANVLGIEQAFKEGLPVKYTRGKGVGFDKRGMIVTARALFLLGGTSAALYMLNKDEKWYKELPDYVKDFYWVFKAGDQIIRIPKPHLMGMTFGTTAERLLRAANDDPEAMKGLLTSFGNTVPSSIGDFTPQLMKGWLEAAANYDYFRDSPIVPQNVKDASPENQITAYTSSVAKELGGYFGVSPAKLEHVLKSFTGQLAIDLVKLLDNEQDRKEHTVKDIPIAGRFVTRPPTMGTSASVTNFYKEFNKLEGNRSANKLTPTDKRILQSYTKVSQKLSELRKRRKLLLEKEQTDEIKSKVADIDNRAIDLAVRARARALELRGRSTQ